MGTPETGHTDDFTRLSFICSMENIWLHISGVSLSNLVLSYRQNLSDLTGVVSHGNSLTLDIGLWFGLPTLPNVTLYKETEDIISNRSVMQKLLGICTKQEYLLPIVVWTTILSIGNYIRYLAADIQYCFSLFTEERIYLFFRKERSDQYG